MCEQQSASSGRTFEIRPYRGTDCAAMARLFYHTVHTVNLGDYTRLQVDAWADGAPDLSAWDASFRAHLTLVAVRGNQIIGFADLADGTHLQRLYVDAGAQRMGVATALCEKMEAACSTPLLSVDASITARPFFEKRGWKTVRRQTVERHGVRMENFHMVKQVRFGDPPTLWMIGGTMGVGKTTVSRILSHRLLEGSVFLDGDWCWDAHPFLVTEQTRAMVLDNISYLLNNFLRCSAYRHIVFCWVMHEQSIIDAITVRLQSPCRIIPVSLLCSERTLYRRLNADIRAGVRTRDVLERSLSRLPLYLRLNTIPVDTDGLTPLAAAQRLRLLTEP